MKQQLWIINSSFLGFFLLAYALTVFLKVESPQVRLPKKMSRDLEKKKEAVIPIGYWDPIFKNDIFNTYVVAEQSPVQKQLVTPVREIKEPAIVPPPPLPKQEFVDALKISIKGIIVADDESRNVAMIEDETQKESLYHLGDKIKDGQIIKIARSRVVILRANGQQEIFYLRKDDLKIALGDADRWQYIVKKTSDTSFQIDPDTFKLEAGSLGTFLDNCAIIGTVYKKGVPLGIRVGTLEKEDLGSMIGLQTNDIIIDVYSIPTGPMKNRIMIYDKIQELEIDSSFDVTIQRSGGMIKISYRLAKMNKSKQNLFPGDTKIGENKKDDADLKSSKLQEREKSVREFQQNHNTAAQQQETIARIRERLLENLKSRLKDTRVR